MRGIMLWYMRCIKTIRTRFVGETNSLHGQIDTGIVGLRGVKVFRWLDKILMANVLHWKSIIHHLWVDKYLDILNIISNE